MAVVYLIRHGQASFGRTNYDQLSDLGHQQSARLGAVLQGRMPVFDKVCLGSMLRHKQTAQKCLNEFDHSVDQINAKVDGGWNEYNHQDILAQYHPEFITPESMRAFLKKQENPKKAFEYHFNKAMERWIHAENEGGYDESWMTFTGRVHAALEQVLADTPHSKNVAVFTSGGPISLIAQSLLGVDQEQIMKMNWTLLNCGVTKVVSTNHRVFVSSLNDHSHFEGEQYKHFFTYT